MEAMQQNQRTRTWKWLPPVDASERIVGIMGMGTLGSDAAKKLVSFGFQVVSWSRSLKAIDGVTSFHGDEHLDGFLTLCTEIGRASCRERVCQYVSISVGAVS